MARIWPSCSASVGAECDGGGVRKSGTKPLGGFVASSGPRSSRAAAFRTARCQGRWKSRERSSTKVRTARCVSQTGERAKRTASRSASSLNTILGTPLKIRAGADLWRRRQRGARCSSRWPSTATDRLRSALPRCAPRARVPRALCRLCAVSDGLRRLGRRPDGPRLRAHRLVAARVAYVRSRLPAVSRLGRAALGGRRPRPSAPTARRLRSGVRGPRRRDGATRRARARAPCAARSRRDGVKSLGRRTRRAPAEDRPRGGVRTGPIAVPDRRARVHRSSATPSAGRC